MSTRRIPVTQSRIIDIRQPITSRSAAHKARKALDTLGTTQAILAASGQDLLADALISQIECLQAQIRDFYRRQEGN